MKIDFLDFDGVLNIECEGTDIFGFECVIDSKKLTWLNKLCGQVPEVRVVLSTSWREWDYDMTVGGLKKVGLWASTFSMSRFLMPQPCSRV